MESFPSITPSLPTELWDYILGFFSTKNLVKTKLVNKFFFNLITSNKGFKTRILLYKNNQEGTKLEYQILWLIDNGQLEGLKYLYINSSSAREYMESYRKYLPNRASGCVHSATKIRVKVRLKVLIWLIKTFNLTRKELLGDSYNSIFRSAALQGFLKILKWIHLTYNLTREYVISDNNFTFIYATGRGHLKVSKWIHSTFKLTRNDIIARNNDACRGVIAENHLRTLKWLHSTFKLTKEDIEDDADYTIGWGIGGAARHDHVDILKWIHSTFTLSKEDKWKIFTAITEMPNIKKDQSKVLQWLRTN